MTIAFAGQDWLVAATVVGLTVGGCGIAALVYELQAWRERRRRRNGRRGYIIGGPS